MFADNEKEMHEWIDAIQTCGAKKMVRGKNFKREI